MRSLVGFRRKKASFEQKINNLGKEPAIQGFLLNHVVDEVVYREKEKKS